MSRWELGTTGRILIRAEYRAYVVRFHDEIAVARIEWKNWGPRGTRWAWWIFGLDSVLLQSGEGADDTPQKATSRMEDMLGWEKDLEWVMAV